LTADELREIARSVRRLAELHAEEALAAERAGDFPKEAWRALAELGVLGLAASDGSMTGLAAALGEFGRVSFPGPLVATAVAARLLDAGDRVRLTAGELVVAVGAPPFMPWADAAERFIVIESGRAWLAEATDLLESVRSIGGEPWGRVALRKTSELGDATLACASGDVALAAYVAGAGSELLRAAVEHARTRKQFGRAIGEFQAVSHPLASVAVRLSAADALVRSAARALDDDEPSATSLAAAARFSALRAALEAAGTAPQVFGALGVLVEGPVFALARRIRQWASSGDDHVRARRAVLAPLRQKERS
jgi:alkylation response protein AidB-like acyl-CoA dehydrogenase